jgi:SAM-dependent methyltransferase
VKNVIERAAGRSTFGNDPAKYDWARPRYPDALYQILRDRCGLRAGVRTFEIGAGTGIATRRLLELGARPLSAIEPDARLAAYLEQALPSDHLKVMQTSFEDADLPDAGFALGASATAFHWLEQAPSLAKVHRLLKPGGWWAMWWNHYGNPDERTAFDRATEHLFAGTKRTPSQGTSGRPTFDGDIEARTADLAEAGFVNIRHERLRSSFTFETERLVALYGSFSVTLHLPPAEREVFLAELAKIIDRDFGGRVERPLTTNLYIAQREL